MRQIKRGASGKYWIRKASVTHYDMRRSMLAIVAVLLNISTLAFADVFTDAMAAYNKGDYATAFRLMQTSAEAGLPMAQYELGYMYAEGQGVAQDLAQAVAWYRKAADQGDAPAQFSLGDMLAKGRGAPLDNTQAASWYRKAADQGHILAQYAIGVMYSAGNGIAQDFASAFFWYHKAAEQGFVPAQRDLGVLYFEGRGVAQSVVQALMWLSVASAGGDTSVIEARDRIAAQMTPAQIAEAQRLAREWKPKLSR